MKNKNLLILILFLLLFSFKTQASELCSEGGYTVIYINGIFTDNNEALFNKNALKYKLSDSYNGEPLVVDYVHNQTHLGGFGDLVDVARQGLFDPKSDYDLVEMMDDASDKIKTQKVLLVGHSQGNFYTNNLYDKVADRDGGIPSNSIGVYGVASPDKRVAGGGKYLTSDTDQVIAVMVNRLKTILEPNTHIDLTKEDGNGHSFSGVYLKYKSKEIVRDIKSSLDKLETNTIQDTNSRCIVPQKISALHKITGAILAIEDATIGTAIKNASLAIGSVNSAAKSLASTLFGLGKRGLALVGFASDIPEITPTPVPEINIEDVLVPEENNNILNQPNTIADSTTNIEENRGEETTVIVPGQEAPAVIISGHSGGGGNNSSGDNPVNIIPKDENTETPPIVSETPVIDNTAPIIELKGDSLIYLKLNDTYVEPGATATDDKDGETPVVISGVVDTAVLGEYVINYTATDKANNTKTVSRTVKVSSYIYLPKYSFGISNGDGKNWQAWSFTGSNVYDWTDTYIGNYLHEQFKIQSFDPKEYSCTQCLQRGIFNHDPRKGFEISDVKISSLENNPQTHTTGITYDVSLQWDATGYTYTISHNGVIDNTGHTNITGVNNDMWVGWDGSFNNFKNFPSGRWFGVVPFSAEGRVGGDGMVLEPHPVYKDFSNGDINLSLPTSGISIGSGITPTHGRENITPFSFEVIYRDTDNNSPSSINLNITNNTTGENLPSVSMSKNTEAIGDLGDGDFVNGESYIVRDLLFDAGDYEYSFSIDGSSAVLKNSENGSLHFKVIPSTYKYIPKYSLGSDNGDGKDWQAWAFNGANIHSWSDTYKNNYLHEQFKIQTYRGSYSCSSRCLQRGIFNHDPQKGFEASDLVVSTLEDNPQNKIDDITYDVSIQWDNTGYTYTISHNGTIDNTGYTNITGVNNDMWVGWDETANNFQNFPSGRWYGVLPNSPEGKAGGNNLMMKPFPIYDPLADQEVEVTPSNPILSSSKEISSFSFGSLSSVVTGDIDENNLSIKLTVPYGTDITSLSPTILFSDKATISPASSELKDFTLPVSYTVTAEDKTTKVYTVTVLVASKPDPEPNPEPIPDTSLPIIKSYSFNNIQGDVSFNPATDSVDISLVANKNVIWSSLEIEREGNSSDYRIYYPYRSGCVGSLSTCSKIWDGKLSPADRAPVYGVYRVKVHIKDENNKEYYDYLPSLITVTGQSTQILTSN